MADPLTYATLERIGVPGPVDRLDFIADRCRDRRVLDLGCLDETALQKRDTRHWLHGRIAAVAQSVVGIDSSAAIPADGIRTGERSFIYAGDGTDPAAPALLDADIDVIVAGEFIEHIESPLAFFRTMQRRYPGREMLISTPNGLSFANSLLATIGREAQHPDHLQIFTYKILNTLCQRAGFQAWDIIPYRFYATEMLLQSRGAKHALTRVTEVAVRLTERLFPLVSFGYILRIQL